MHEHLRTILQSVPPYPEILIAAAISSVAILAAGVLSGVLKRHASWQTGYTRKLFHFLIFSAAVGLHLWGGMPAVNLLGAGMGVFVLLAVAAGEGNLFFEALAREKDYPRRGYFIIVPYLTTALGGLISNLLFGACAVMGYIVCGAADAIAEPVGVRFGRHRYRVPSLRRVRVAERSIEGSLSVFIASLLLSAVFFYFPYQLPTGNALLFALLLSAAVTFVEAVSFHGADNLTIQITASGLAFLFIQIAK